jgi:hypothetical protein
MQTPTLETLAQLAATMATPAESPASTASRALALWQACAGALAQLEYRTASKSAIDSGNGQFDAAFAPGDSVPLEKFLAAIMPRSKSPDRMAKWRACLAANVAFSDRLSGAPVKAPAKLAEAVAEIVKRDRENGIPRRLLFAQREMFEQFIERDRAQKNAERGKKAARAKKILGASKTARKRPQVRKSKP